MMCPICRQKVPFGLAMHMHAVHGPKSAEFQRRSTQTDQETTPQRKKRTYRKRKAAPASGKRALQHPRLSKLS